MDAEKYHDHFPSRTQAMGCVVPTLGCLWVLLHASILGCYASVAQPAFTRSDAFKASRGPVLRYLKNSEAKNSPIAWLARPTPQAHGFVLEFWRKKSSRWRKICSTPKLMGEEIAGLWWAAQKGESPTYVIFATESSDPEQSLWRWWRFSAGLNALKEDNAEEMCAISVKGQTQTHFGQHPRWHPRNDALIDSDRISRLPGGLRPAGT